ncbi:MAG: hypothetical protein WCF22_21215 [Candidatus Sulfotelmatobacter sp.]
MEEGRPDIHKELAELQRQERNLRELLSVPRASMDKEELVVRLREVRGEIARIETQLHARYESKV